MCWTIGSRAITGTKAQTSHCVSGHIIFGQVAGQGFQPPESCGRRALKKHRFADHARMTEIRGENHAARIERVEVHRFQMRADAFGVVPATADVTIPTPVST